MYKKNTNLIKSLLAIALCLLVSTCHEARATARIKDIVEFEGIRDNPLVGYGLVVGLNGTGDNLNNSVFTEQSLIDYLSRLGLSTLNLANNINTRNVAAVMVTAKLPPFANPGKEIPMVYVSTMGDAKSVKGGRLLPTTLLGADNEVYAIAQGSIIIGQPSEGTSFGNNQDKPIPTSGYILNGAIVEKSINFALDSMDEVRLSLKNPDLTTARAIATAINSHTRSNIAYPNDPSTVTITIPYHYRKGVVNLLADIENIVISPDTTAKIVIDSATGTIIIGENVTISNVAISQGDLNIKVGSDDKFLSIIDGLPPLTDDQTLSIGTINSNTTLSDLVDGLNTLGVKPKQLIAILNMLKQAGALQAEIAVY